MRAVLLPRFIEANGLIRPHLAGEAHDVADDLRHRLEMLLRHGFVELDRGIEGACQRRVLDNRDFVLQRHLADLDRQRVHAFGDADWRRHLGAELHPLAPADLNPENYSAAVFTACGMRERWNGLSPSTVARCMTRRAGR